ncbi:MAG TPA: response regulator [Elusimicrobiota bacterium]|jgi:CheY-like chemotaxis protein|nr:response regulator [Elusimicrobiota bacterium]HNF58290.1 response regulator [Elusimicrobiota bacterium]HNG44496.1 response regulator [Elusimicrobiota bacterium]HNI58063.1 response regulator [Elusimicrobiota bacterium]
MADAPDKKSVVLVVEDDEAILEFLATTLEMEGYEVFSATDGQKGLDMIVQHHPGAVLLDLMMPGLDGFGVLEKMAERNDTAKIPVTVVSAYADAGPARELLAKAKNVQKVFTKPVRSDELLRQVKAMLDSR